MINLLQKKLPEFGGVNSKYTINFFPIFIVFFLAAFFLTALPVQAKYAAIVMDATSGEVLFARNADTRNYPASLTKMMTLYMLFEALETHRIRLHQRLPVSSHAASRPPSRLGLKPGQTITVQQAIKALVTKSANDVASVVAEALGQTEPRFAAMMTAKARLLGMRNTTFRNASGLQNRKQTSTARDMALLARALMRAYPGYYHYFSTSSFTFAGRTYGNHNKLLRSYPGADGLKTGYVNASGYNLALSARRQNKRLIGIVFGGKSPKWRDWHMRTIMDDGFKAAQAGFGGRSYQRVAQTKARYTTDMARNATPREIKRSRAIANYAISQKKYKAPVMPGQTRSISRAKTRIKTTKLAALSPRSSSVIWNNGVDYWGIQVGAFAKLEDARKTSIAALRTLKSFMAPGKLTITAVNLKGKHYYRARLMGMSQKRARAACIRLKAKKTDCMVVAPSPNATLAQLVL